MHACHDLAALSPLTRQRMLLYTKVYLLNTTSMTYRAHLFRLRGFVTTPASAAAACRSTCTGP